MEGKEELRYLISGVQEPCRAAWPHSATAAAHQVFMVSALVPRAVPSSTDASGAEAEHCTVWHTQRQQDVLGWLHGNFCKYLSA